MASRPPARHHRASIAALLVQRFAIEGTGAPPKTAPLCGFAILGRESAMGSRSGYLPARWYDGRGRCGRRLRSELQH